jgi:hypothetical protein
MTNNASSRHVQVNIYDTSQQMLATLYGSCVIPIFPEGPLPIFPLVVFLPGSTGHELYRPGDHISISIVDYQQVDVV